MSESSIRSIRQGIVDQVLSVEGMELPQARNFMDRLNDEDPPFNVWNVLFEALETNSMCRLDFLIVSENSPALIRRIMDYLSTAARLRFSR